jgi:hypothetical protein
MKAQTRFVLLRLSKINLQLKPQDTQPDSWGGHRVIFIAWRIRVVKR